MLDEGLVVVVLWRQPLVTGRIGQDVLYLRQVNVLPAGLFLHVVGV